MDVLMYLFLAVLLIPANIWMVKWHKNGNFPLWASGIILAVFGIGLGYLAREFLLSSEAGQGGAIMAAFVGFVVIANGAIHFLAGAVLAAVKRFSAKRTQA